jgi:membrane protein DedA with SNARE-associated domain
MIATVQDLLRSAGAWSLIPIFIVIALESSAFVGMLFPGEMAALIAGALSASGACSPWLAFAAVAGGAIAGDLGGYALGRFKGKAVLARWAFARRHYEQNRERLEGYFARWGVATVLVARFVAVGRAFAPFVAGLSAMPARRFATMAVLAGLLWGGALVAAGFLLGNNWSLVETWMGSLGAGILILFVITIAMVALWRWVAARQTEITAVWQRRAQQYGIDLAPLAEFMRARFSPSGYLGLHLTVGLIAVGAMAWIFGGVTQDIFAQDPLVRVDRMVAGIIANHRNADLDAFVAVLKFLGSSWWLIFVATIAAAACILAGDALLALTAGAILGGAYALAYGLQISFAGFSPAVAPAHLIHGFQGFPSITLTDASAVYGLTAYAVASHAKSWRMQTLAVLIALYLILIVWLGALYSGRLLSATIGGFALGGFWLAVCLTGNLTYSRMRAGGQ